MPADRSGPIAAVVLAAGMSSRMGSNKLLFAWDGETLLRRAARRALEAGLDPVIVVLGHEADLARHALEGLPCRTVVNPEYATGGVHLSLRAGAAAVPETSAGALVMLADMPFVSADMLRDMIRRYHESAAPLVASRYGDVQAPPTLYDRSLLPELTTAEGPGCGKAIVRRHAEAAIFVAWPPECLDDVDVPADYERAQARLPVS
jgi:molybdenum cofactor cytidylyltransferase